MNTEITLFILQSDSGLKPSINVIELLMKGGVVMIPLAILSVLAVMMIVERLLFFSKNIKNSEKVFQEFIQHIHTRNLNAASELCQKEKNSWGRVFVYATLSSSDSAEEIDDQMEEAAEVEISRLEKGLNYLSIIAGVAPLLGFIGTIVGVITIFFDISVSQDISISVISEGLYKKMVTSAAGLVIGIIAFSAYHLFQNHIDQYVNRVREQSLQLKIALRSRQK